ncbi:hypothetical protein CANCADRAFT_148708 [Tortispora caseinolytica NRRL Y-17796]|uniref:Diphosphomevalonate decarboxylase n=1 Tax=Tortispora caseinolytica NRRL Y-17796 TaxID=767744 RepID=A0A1E4T9M5_9ASCO|nr:hypothetical protein CANCADRAFT_148708 [Tortispora caseinolytica NRRL Y-17796]
MPVFVASAKAPVNIATLKYWGKRDTKLNLPTNSSISVTLSTDDLAAYTTATASPAYKDDSLVLNGIPEPIEQSARLSACLRELRALRAALEQADSSLPPLSSYHVHVFSKNNFPTAAGLASSAAGFAALVRAVANLFELPQSPEELSRIARQGSGSACRSLMGGFVGWEMGSKDDGSDSLAVQIAPKSHWPTIKAAILVISAQKKDISSTSGMQTTVKTSSLFQHRIQNVVPRRYEEMKNAILNHDFELFATLTMADSNQFHAVCLDSMPPIFYMNDASRQAIRAVEELNRAAGKTIAAYTFDAGPNCVIYYQQEDEQAVLGLLRTAVPDADKWTSTNASASLLHGYNTELLAGLDNAVTQVILTSIGDAPVSTEEHLDFPPVE